MFFSTLFFLFGKLFTYTFIFLFPSTKQWVSLMLWMPAQTDDIIAFCRNRKTYSPIIFIWSMLPLIMSNKLGATTTCPCNFSLFPFGWNFLKFQAAIGKTTNDIIAFLPFPSPFLSDRWLITSSMTCPCKFPICFGTSHSAGNIIHLRI